MRTRVTFKDTVTLVEGTMVGQAAQQPAVDVDLERKLSSFGNVSRIQSVQVSSKASNSLEAAATASRTATQRIVGSTDVPCTFIPEVY